MNVLSLFDGMSCGRIALDRVGLPVTSYFAAEIDKYAIQVSKANWNNVKHIGDVTRVKDYMLPEIDLLIGGSPCQGFSFAGKQLNFSDPRSALFFEFVRLLKECKPKWFFLENVVMKKEYQQVITAALGVEPILINSALVSAQNRKRLYWTNIPFYGQPRDKGILLKHILETEGIGFIKNRDNYYERNEKSMNLCANYHKGADNHGQRTIIRIGTASDIKGHDIIRRVYSTEGKSPNLDSCSGGNRGIKIAIDGYKYRLLTPVESERLQTVPDNYTVCVSNTQRYKMLGNGWNIDTIVHLLKPLKYLDIL